MARLDKVLDIPDGVIAETSEGNEIIARDILIFERIEDVRRAGTAENNT